MSFETMGDHTDITGFRYENNIENGVWGRLIGERSRENTTVCRFALKPNQ